jgi:dTDP-4-dehydrorhamnose 3,5-epimerase
VRFAATEISGVFQVSTAPHQDDRGSFARLYCPQEFSAAGLPHFHPAQVNLSHNDSVRTLRGMHFQSPPHSEAKLVHVVRGSIFDVAIDLRASSPSYRCWITTVLDARLLNAVFIPEGCAHGFLTLEPNTDVLYHMSRCYEPGHDRGIRWNDPAFHIEWPATPLVIGVRDQTWPNWTHENAAESAAQREDPAMSHSR